MLQSIILNSGILTFGNEFWSNLTTGQLAALRCDAAGDEVFVNALDRLKTHTPSAALNVLRKNAKYDAISKLAWLEGAHDIYGVPYDYIGAVPRDIIGMVVHYLSTKPGVVLGVAHGHGIKSGARDTTHTWHRFGNLHREDGPAHIYNSPATRSFLWYCNGVMFHHRGPSQIFWDRVTGCYYYNGIVTSDPRVIAEVARLSAEYNLDD